MIGPPMQTHNSAAARLSRSSTTVLFMLVAAAVAACSAPTPTATARLESLTPGPSPTPTPLPTPLFSNSPDAALIALIPTVIAGHPVVVPAITEFGLTPGDIGEVYGQLGLRFRALQVAFIERPRLSLYAVHMAPPDATMQELEPYLAAAGEYVGIAGLHREPWTLQPIGGRMVWTREGDGATLPGTALYTWTTGGYLFLMIGVDQRQNLAMLAALPAEPAPTPTPAPSLSPGASGSQAASPSPT
jgi:hypothetical protein